MASWLWRIVSSHSDARWVGALRAFAERTTALLHAENHDIRTNGESELLRLMSADAHTIVDVGANRGDWTVEARCYCPNATIYCSELVSATRERLEERLRGVQGVQVLPFGLSDHSGIETVKYYPGRDKVASFYDYPHPEAHAWLRERVRTGDECVEELGMASIDLLKIDTEGADLRVLKGFERTLNRGLITVVQFEYGFACVLARSLLIDFYDYLQAKGFVIGKLHAQGVRFRAYRLEDENFFGPNFVAVHGSRSDLLERLRYRR